MATKPLARIVDSTNVHRENRAQPAANSLIAEQMIQGKIALGQTIITAAMTWWVSSVVFCASIIAGTWLKRADIYQLRTVARLLFCVIVFLFFVSVVAFGILTYRAFRRLGREIGELRAFLKKSTMSSERAWEFDFAATATALGTSSFILIALTWFGISAQIIKG